AIRPSRSRPGRRSSSSPVSREVDAMHGVHGRYLHIDLDTGSVAEHPIPEEGSIRVSGGVGLASLLLYRWAPPGVDPLAPENPLIFATSPFIGPGITTPSQVAPATQSPPR